MSALKYWIWLASMKKVDVSKLFPLLDSFGTPENVYYAADGDYKDIERLTEREINALKDKNLDGAERILEDCDMLGIRVVTIQDAEFPDRLKNIYSPPCVLYIKGRMFSYDEEPAISVVGTRSATPYGLVTAEKISYQIAKCGGIIVSGLAKGIDSAAHRGALKAGAPTIGILGCGTDVIFPSENEYLYEDVAATGAIITEYPPKTQPSGSHFPARNRIISGITLGTIVVEAPAKSGALITAELALEQGHDVFAVPGNIDSKENEGTNNLIKQGAALITNGWDVLKEYEAMFPHKISFHYDNILKKEREMDESYKIKVAQPVMEFKTAAHKEEDTKNEGYIDLTEKIKDFTDDERNIIVSIAGKARHIDDIIEITGIPPGNALSALTLLEVQGVVKQLPGKRFALIL